MESPAPSAPQPHPGSRERYHLLEDGRWRRASDGDEGRFDDRLMSDWVAYRFPPPATPGAAFGPGGDDVQLWGKTEEQAHRWVRDQSGWRGYEVARVPGSWHRYRRLHPGSHRLHVAGSADETE